VPQGVFDVRAKSTRTALRVRRDLLAASPFIQAHDLRPRARIEMQIKADHRCRCIGRHVEPVDFYGEHSEQAAVRMVALWRARAAIARRAEIGACLQCARRQLAARGACSDFIGNAHGAAMVSFRQGASVLSGHGWSKQQSTKAEGG